MEPTEISVNPEMLILARQSRGISQIELAEMLSVSRGWLSKVEGDIKKITIDQLHRIAEILDYPIDFFTNEQRVYGPGINEMFHRQRKNVPVKILDKNQAQMEIRRMHLSKLLNGVDLGELDIKTYDLCEYNKSVKDIARAVRANWNLPRGPIRNVTKTIEQARGIVIPLDFETTLIDSTSYWPPNMPPLFFADMKRTGDRLRFSLSHELGHIVMHQDNPNPNMEQQADEFAAEFLMPESEIRPYLSDLSLPKLATLKPYWKVSMAALLKRAQDLGEITPRHAKTLWVQMGKAGYRLREPVELDIPIENPVLLEQIIGVYSDEMKFSLGELAKMLRLHQHEICHIYFGFQLDLRHKELQATIEEAEDILNKYRK